MVRARGGGGRFLGSRARLESKYNSLLLALRHKTTQTAGGTYDVFMLTQLPITNYTCSYCTSSRSLTGDPVAVVHVVAFNGADIPHLIGRRKISCHGCGGSGVGIGENVSHLPFARQRTGCHTAGSSRGRNIVYPGSVEGIFLVGLRVIFGDDSAGAKLEGVQTKANPLEGVHAVAIDVL